MDMIVKHRNDRIYHEDNNIILKQVGGIGGRVSTFSSFILQSCVCLYHMSSIICMIE